MRIAGRNNGSRMVALCVTLIDIALAVFVFGVVAYSGLDGVPTYFRYHDAESVMCVLLAALCGQTLSSSIIYRRRISVLDVLVRVGRLVIIHSIVLMFALRMLVVFSQGVFRTVFYYSITYFVLLLLVRFGERLFLNYLRRIGMNRRVAVFVGSDPANFQIYRELMSSPSVGYVVSGYYSNNYIKDAPEQFKRLGDRNSLVEAMRNGEDVLSADVVFTSLSATYDDDDINTIIDYCDRHVIQFYLVPRIYANLRKNLTPMSVGDYTVFTNHTNNINNLDNRIVKRVFDIVFSLIVCLLLLPFIPIIWIIVKMQSPGPLIFAQERTGLNGDTFTCYKFRSMHVNSDADKVQATKDDPRKFPFGEFMRRTNIDELPQFFNVLKGDMSVVGPRPHMLYHTEMYSSVISKYMARHFSKPGITGWSQVTGYRGETKELWQMEERIKRDIWYNENWSFMLDLEIIIRTMMQVVSPDEHAY